MAQALILTDIQNDFLAGGTLQVPDGDRVVPVANRLMRHFDLVVATQDWHPADHGSFASNHPDRRVGDTTLLGGVAQTLWPDHCVQNTHGAGFAPTLHTAGIARVFPKGMHAGVDSYSGFFDNDHRVATGLGDFLRSRGVDRVFVMGLATDYCVKATALDARRLGFDVKLILDGIRGVELRQGDCRAAIDEMAAAGVEPIQSHEITETARPATVWEGRFVRVADRDRWEYASRRDIDGIVAVVAVTDSRQLVLVEQYRPPIARTVIELPAGLAGDTEAFRGESLEQAARRELLEEAGYEARRMIHLVRGVPSPGLTDEVVDLFLAEGLTRRTRGGGDGSEDIVVHEVPVDRTAEWLAEQQRRGAFVDFKILAGLYLAEKNATMGSDRQ